MRWGKRTFDVLASGVGLVALAPVFAVIGAAVVLADRGPMLYRQERIGRGGRPFQMLKFRTMVVDADRTGPLLTVGGDPRVTRVGAFLRRTKLDELPQLINVLRGEMTLVGPRPEVGRYVQHYSASQRAVLELTPGITDPASVAYHDEAALLAAAADPERRYIEEIMPHKLQINLQYAQRATLLRDVVLILRTVGLMAGHARPRERL